MIFPAIKTSNTVQEQVEKVVSECQEAIDELTNLVVCDDLIIEECLDVVHASETLLRLLMEKYGEDEIQFKIFQIFGKNKDRGYYG